MRVQNVINKFLNQRKENELLESSKTMYKRKLDVFLQYLYHKQGLNDNNFDDLFSGMKKETILESTKTYINLCNISTYTSIQGYISVLSEFFKFIYDEESIKNLNFINTKEKEKLDSIIKELIKEYNLSDSKEQSPPFSSDTINSIILKCEQCISEYHKKSIDTIKHNSKYDSTYSRYLSGIITKIAIYSGIKNSTIDNLKITDYENSRLRINNLWIQLPNKLNSQLNEYTSKIRNLYDIHNCEHLFITRKGEHCNYNSAYFRIVSDLYDTNSNAMISKHRIIEYIKEELPINLIMKITGYGMPTLLHCYDIVETLSADIENKTIKTINSTLIKNDLFYKL